MRLRFAFSKAPGARWFVLLVAAPAIALAGASPRLQISPEQAFVDQSVTISLWNAPAKTNVVIIAKAIDDAAQAWESHGEFQTDARGFAEAGGQTSKNSRKANAARWFWSMTLTGTNRGSGYFKCGSLKPVTYEFTAELNGEQIASARFERLFVLPGVERVPVREQGLRGVYFKPSGKGAHPAVIVLTGSGGGLNEPIAAFLASKGYAALALAYFNYEDLPKTLENIPLEYFDTALKWLDARKEVRAGQIAVLGGSRGGELVLLLGATFPEIKAVVAISPSGIIWGGLGGHQDEPEQPAWTYHGRALPFMDSAHLTPDQLERINKAFQTDSNSWPAAFEISMENRDDVEKATIPVHQIHGPVLLISGKDDTLWPSSLMADRVMQQLKEAKHPYRDKILEYEGAGHVFLLPNLPTTVNTVIHPILKMEISLGGEAAPTAAAALDAWKQVVDFLGRALGR